VIEADQPGLAGQWVGTSLGDPSAQIILDLDAQKGSALGFVYLYPQDANIPACCAPLKLPDQLKPQVVEANAMHFDSYTAYVPNLEELHRKWPAATFPEEVSVEIEPMGVDVLKVIWSTPVGTGGEAVLNRTGGGSSNLTADAEVTTWQDFQQHVTQQSGTEFVFRGQSEPWPLRSSFHRTNRKDLQRYVREDVPKLHQALTGRMNHIFDLRNPQQNGAFLNLAQHHGFPTPLIDWTRSPFVAAYFAYSGALKSQESEPVRIFAFDHSGYAEQGFFQSQMLSLVRPHFSTLEALSIENDRAIPQQGLLTLTNLNDLEGHIQENEELAKKRFLFAFDLRRDEAEKALSDLRLMGITHATLFPGIESICSEVRERNFS